MPYCPECGANQPAEQKYCTECGALMPAQQTQQYTTYTTATPNAPTYTVTTAQTQPVNPDEYKFFTVADWIKTFLLACIPFVSLVWLFGGSKYKTRVNYARAAFLLGVIVFFVTLILEIIIMVIVGEALYYY